MSCEQVPAFYTGSLTVDFDRGAALNGEGGERIVAHIPYLTKLADPLVAGALAGR